MCDLSLLSVPISGRRLYINPDIPAPERTTAGVRRDMKLAVELQTPVNGLKGPSAFWSLQYLDLVECFTVEYMHCVLLGVTRQFTDYWFDSSRCHENFYIGQYFIVLPASWFWNSWVYEAYWLCKVT